MNFKDWRVRHPQAAQELLQIIGAEPPPQSDVQGEEAQVQQQLRFKLARKGILSWRNNVGATPAEEEHSCPRCHFKFKVRKQPVRYGLANDSAKLNARIKSHDLILLIPRIIKPADVGTTIGQFGTVDAKRPGWRFTNSKRDQGQANWATLIEANGGYARFSTGDLDIL